MKRHKYVITISLALLLLFFIPLNKIHSIPAFARKYQISCQVCHSPAMPRLKGFGEEFAGNGFRLTEYESPRYLIQTGDDRLSLFRELPLAIRMDGFGTYNFNNEGTADFGSPFVLKILSGGELSEKLSYYFYFLFNERGSIAGVEDAFLMYHDLFNTGINFYIGQFQVSDPLFKGELRYTLEPYKIYAAAPGSSSVDLKYDRGIILEKDIIATGTTLVGEIVNGCGIGEAGEGYLFDRDKHKNFMGRINQAIGKKLSVGLFGYFGKENLADTLGIFTNDIRMFGPDLVLNFDDKFVVNVQYVRRTDSDVFIESTGEVKPDILTHGTMAEVIYSPRGDMSTWYLTGLLNWVESDFDALDYRSATLHAGYILRRNVRLVSEYTYKFSGTSYGKLSLGFISAF
ncbi:MAG: hypothetical protein MUC93_06130 [Bacteroidales bacterium]|jgi:hypothetical protein|nr:hypothetical protein [Bacteroidales bacterium]